MQVIKLTLQKLLQVSIKIEPNENNAQRIDHTVLGQTNYIEIIRLYVYRYTFIFKRDRHNTS